MALLPARGVRSHGAAAGCRLLPPLASARAPLVLPVAGLREQHAASATQRSSPAPLSPPRLTHPDFFIKLLLGDIRQKKTYGPTYIE